MKQLLLWNNDPYADTLSGLIGYSTVAFTFADLDLKLSDTSKYTSLIILCELKYNENDGPVKMQDFYGLVIAKLLRLRGVSLPIIFTSFFSRKQVYSDKPDREIIKTIGHDFIQLPILTDLLLKLVKAGRKLTATEMTDVKLFACNPDGIVRAKIHQLPSIVQKLSTNGPLYVQRELIICIKEIHNAFQKNYENYLSEFNSFFQEITVSNIDKALRIIIDKGNDLIDEYIRLKSNHPKAHPSVKKPWKLLLLDDEIDTQSDLVRAVDNKGVDVICTHNAKGAFKALAKDNTFRGKIPLILTDYRLYEEVEELQIQQKTQGYTFLQEVGEQYQAKLITAIVYSGMPRQFLLETFRTYKIRTEIYSKIDFRINDAGAINFLSDRIIEVGNANYMALLALPLGNRGWENHLHGYYLKFRNLTDYEVREKAICDYCTLWVDQFRAGLKPTTPMIKGDAFEAKKNEKETETMRRFEAYYKTRRLAQYLYLYFSCISTITDIKREIAVYLMPSNKSLKIKKTVDGFFSQILGLSPTEFPFGATIEELCWFEYDLNIMVLESYSRYRKKITESENALGYFIASQKSIKAKLAASIYHYKGEKGRELRFDSTNFNPLFFDKLDIGICLEWLDQQMELLNKEEIKELIDLHQTLQDIWK
jgi:hypothetical protein